MIDALPSMSAGGLNSASTCLNVMLASVKTMGATRAPAAVYASTTLFTAWGLNCSQSSETPRRAIRFLRDEY
jgi:hypothetical protein